MVNEIPRKKVRAEEARKGDEARFLARYDPKKFDRPSVTVDVVLLTVKAGKLSTLLIKR